ncbi:hypothetical protein [Thalassobaculum sp.]|uniref:hypothetical protein n=1 Tax=Thalassobaculum sp. TaxID=2022740 RepID=UPI0032EEDD43
MTALRAFAGTADRREPTLAGPDAFAAYLADQTTRALVARHAASRGWPAATVQGGGLSAAARTLAVAEPPAILLVDVSDCADPLGDFDNLAEAIDSGCRVIAVGASNDARLYRGLLAKGASDYLVKPFDEALLVEALARLERRPAPRGDSRPTRKVAVVGVRGGVGASTVGCTLAALFAERHRMRTTLVDLDLRFGDAALALGVTCGPGLRECLEHPDRIDDLFLERAVAEAGERLRVLAAEEPIVDEIPHRTGAFAALAEHLAAGSSMIVVDMPRTGAGLGDVLAAVDDLVLVAELTLSSARDALRLKQMVQAIDGAPQIRIVANRTGRRGVEHLSGSEFESVVGQKLAACLPVDQPATATAASLGRPLTEVAKRSPLVKRLTALAVDIAGAPPRQAGLVGRLFGGAGR